MAIDAGELRWPCRFYKGQAQRSASGAITAPPSGLICDAWARMRGVSAGEQVGGDATMSTATIELMLRKDDRILPADVVLVDGKLWELVGPPIDPDGMGEAMVVFIKPCHTV